MVTSIPDDGDGLGTHQFGDLTGRIALVFKQFCGAGRARTMSLPLSPVSVEADDKPESAQFEFALAADAG